MPLKLFENKKEFEEKIKQGLPQPGSDRLPSYDFRTICQILVEISQANDDKFRGANKKGLVVDESHIEYLKGAIAAIENMLKPAITSTKPETFASKLMGAVSSKKPSAIPPVFLEFGNRLTTLLDATAIHQPQRDDDQFLKEANIINFFTDERVFGNSSIRIALSMPSAFGIGGGVPQEVIKKQLGDELRAFMGALDAGKAVVIRAESAAPSKPVVLSGAVSVQKLKEKFEKKEPGAEDNSSKRGKNPNTRI